MKECSAIYGFEQIDFDPDSDFDFDFEETKSLHRADTLDATKSIPYYEITK